MADYQLTNTSIILRKTDGANIPADSRNVDYIAYCAWTTLGNTADPVPPPPPVSPPFVPPPLS